MWGPSIVVFFVAGVVYGCTGFGFGLLSIPVLSLLFEPALVVPLVSVVSAPLSLGLALGGRPFIKWQLFGLLLVGAVGGIPLGTLVLRQVPVPIMESLVGTCVVAFAVVLLLGWRHPLRSGIGASLFTGGLAGTLGAAMGVPGPPVLLFLASQGETKSVFRANLLVFFAANNVLTLVAYGVAGLLDRDLLVLSAAALPAAIVGAGLGAMLTRRLSEEAFVRLALVLVLVSGLGLLGKGLL